MILVLGFVVGRRLDEVVTGPSWYFSLSTGLGAGLVFLARRSREAGHGVA